MTTPDTSEPRRLRCALFVDFDNVYIGLRRLDPAAAEAFASSPAHWLSALETGSDDEGEFTRRFLIRACYLNPSAFSEFRPYFTRAGFSVVDCPSLTQQGKSSADINLVLDAVDALSAETRYDEFVILSADADFTPLALRFRAADRRVTIVTAGPAASAYRAVADTVVTADQLAELVKPTVLDEPVVRVEVPVPPATPVGDAAQIELQPPAAPGDPAVAAPARATRRRRATAPAAGPVDVPATAAATTEEIPLDAAEVDGPTPVRAAGRRRAVAPATTMTPVVEPQLPPESPARKAVLRLVRSADRPLVGGFVATAAQKADPAVNAAGWGGTGGFFGWLARTVPELGSASKPAPGFVWDPKRFSEADLPSASPVDLPPLQRQVVDVTDIPNLPPDLYRFLLNALAKDVHAQPFNRQETAKRVRDACQASGKKIGKASVNAVVAGVLYAGLDLAAKPAATKVAETWASHVVGLCRGARMQLRSQDVAAIRDWVGGGLVKS